MCFEGAASVGVRADVDLAIGGVLGYCLYARFGVLETKHKSGESSDILSKTFETVQPRRFSVPGISIPSKAARSSVHVIVSEKPTCPCDWRDVGPEFARWIFPFTTYVYQSAPFGTKSASTGTCRRVSICWGEKYCTLDCTVPFGATSDDCQYLHVKERTSTPAWNQASPPQSRIPRYT
jgi:hypothetical protein